MLIFFKFCIILKLTIISKKDIKMKKSKLQQLLQTEELNNHPEVKEELLQILESAITIDSDELDLSKLNLDSYKYLLDKCHYNSDELLFDALREFDKSKRTKMLELAFSYKANPNNIKYITDISEDELDLLLSNGLSINKALKLVVSTDVNDYIDGKKIINTEKVNAQSIMIKKLLNNGADLYQITDTWVLFEIDLIDFYKDLIIEHLGINFLLIGALQASNNFAYNTTEEENSSKIDLAFKLVQFSLENGADVNFNYSGCNALDLVSNKQIIDLLKEYGAISSNTSAEEFFQNDLHYFIWNPQLILEKKYKNLDAEKDLDAKMPSIMHHIWLTHRDDPKEIRPQDIENVIRTKEVFAQGEGIWKHIVWTNDLQLIPASVSKLTESGIEVKSIHDDKDDIASFELIEELIEQKLWGKASDTLRYSLVEYFGGVYADINYIFDRDVTDETYKYNFFTSTFDLYYIENYFFGASPHHPVVQKMVSLVARNLLNPPKYLIDISDQESDVMTDMGTADPTFIAYYLEANKNGNIDVVYPKVEYKEFDGIKLINSIHEIRAQNDYLEEIIEVELYKNQQDQSFLQLTLYLNNNDICGANNYYIGQDSSDGRTWAS